MSLSCGERASLVYSAPRRRSVWMGSISPTCKSANRSHALQLLLIRREQSTHGDPTLTASLARATSAREHCPLKSSASNGSILRKLSLVTASQSLLAKTSHRQSSNEGKQLKPNATPSLSMIRRMGKAGAAEPRIGWITNHFASTAEILDKLSRSRLIHPVIAALARCTTESPLRKTPMKERHLKLQSTSSYTQSNLRLVLPAHLHKRRAGHYAQR